MGCRVLIHNVSDVLFVRCVPALRVATTDMTGHEYWSTVGPGGEVSESDVLMYVCITARALPRKLMYYSTRAIHQVFVMYRDVSGPNTSNKVPT